MATPIKKPAVKKSTTPRKPRAVKSDAVHAHAKVEHHEKTETHTAEHKVPEHKTVEHKVGEHKVGEHKAVHQGKDGRYVYAVGRRKTAVANVRMFSGIGKSTVNHKEIKEYFGNQDYVDIAFKPLQLTGTEKDLYVFVNIKGGGIHAQAQAVAHGLARAIAKATPDFHKVLKKNGMLTRDSRMKERKKPGLKRARRGPQWAKR